MAGKYWRVGRSSNHQGELSLVRMRDNRPPSRHTYLNPKPFDLFIADGARKEIAKNEHNKFQHPTTANLLPLLLLLFSFLVDIGGYLFVPLLSSLIQTSYIPQPQSTAFTSNHCIRSPELSCRGRSYLSISLSLVHQTL